MTYTLKQVLNKAYLKLKPLKDNFDLFRLALKEVAAGSDDAESEEFHKNLLRSFLSKAYYDGDHFINTKGKNDLVIHTGKTSATPVGVIIETKRPSNITEMPKAGSFDVKSLQELLLYYLRERVIHGNLSLTHLIITNIKEWFVFDATIFEKLFFNDKELIKLFVAFSENRLSSNNTDFFYKNIASPAIIAATPELQYMSFKLKDYIDLIDKNDEQSIRKSIHLYKFFSPQNLLKLPFANDSNTLDSAFYTELLHIIGLVELKDGSKKIIGRKPEGERDPGSLLENAIAQLDLSKLKNAQHYGATPAIRNFNVALELVITWVNRILFMKLLEAQLISYNKGSQDFIFLNSEKVSGFGGLNRLFFQILARNPSDRDPVLHALFENVPYLNSSLFEETELEKEALTIALLDDKRLIKVHPHTILKTKTGKKLIAELDPLTYIFEFLKSYDFGTSGTAQILEQCRPLINASVLGLIFEKINGYRDGSFFTPGYVTMYICRQSIRKVVVDKFNAVNGWDCSNIQDLYDKIDVKNRLEANEIFNAIKICDPAVGSGHFLVSALNELISIKSELRILLDRNGNRLKEYQIVVENDELIVTDEDGDVVEYHPSSIESQRVQEALFHEKQLLIENCLFGVDVNPNSVKICRLRLWIELLKNAYYKENHQLETLPNIDINIKVGNSLISRFALDADLAKALKKAKHGVQDYRNAVSTYRNAKTKDEKWSMEKIIYDIKGNFRTVIFSNDPLIRKLRKNQGLYGMLVSQKKLFEQSEQEIARHDAKVEKFETTIEKLEAKIKEIEDSEIFTSAFEWRFEFPEALDDKGNFIGFDLIIGNPPYGVKTSAADRLHLVKNISKVPDYEIYYWFIERSHQLLRTNGSMSLIVPNSLLFNVNAQSYRRKMLEHWTIDEMLDCTSFPIFNDATVRNVVISASKSKSDTFGYRQTSDAKEFSTLIRQPRIITTDDFVLECNQNWALVFKSTPEVISLIARIKDISRPLCEAFPAISQGLIAYDAYQGQDELTIKNRIYHSTTKKDATYMPWINGADVTRYAVKWNGQEFISYGEWIANPRNPLYFNGRRLLIREITNPRIFCGFTDEELYNDPAAIIVKEKKDGFIPLMALLGILNSKLATFFHFNASPKATKGAFPKILVGDISGFPLPEVMEAAALAKLCSLSEARQLANGADLEEVNALDDSIDALVYKLYQCLPTEISIIESSFLAQETAVLVQLQD